MAAMQGGTGVKFVKRMCYLFISALLDVCREPNKSKQRHEDTETLL